ncbi:MAG: PilN domain-containing protein [Deltaproteobacteria bacterium]|nr:PilN domain-containing protein [Deltaproteobacteria bacterium]
MIKINLLGTGVQSHTSGKIWIIGYVASLVLLCGVFFWIHSDVTQRANILKSQSEELQLSLDALKVKTKEVNELKVKRDLLNDKLAIIARLRKSKMGPVRVMDDINRALPEGVWLREIDEKADGMHIKGRALGDQEIVVFLENLKRSRYFRTVDLIETKQMYYAKSSGQVQAAPDSQRLRSGNRVTKEPSMKGGGRTATRGKWSVVGGGGESRSRDKIVDEFNIKIKEFVVNARVDYAGKMQQPGSETSHEGE